MLKRFQPGAVGLAGLLLSSLLLAACGGAAEPAATEQPAPAQGQATAAGAGDAAAPSSPTTEVTEADATTEAAQASAAPAVCEPVDIPTNTLIAPVSDQEWSKGSADAPVTLVEYGDFQ